MSDDTSLTGFLVGSNPTGLLDPKGQKAKKALFGGDSEDPNPNDPWNNIIQAFVNHKEVQKKAQRVNFLSTILSGDQSEPINPGSPKTVMGG